ncbi:MAG: hypothetical protein ACXABY_04865 [Candidatus Thorarchaeota archaeon]
MKSIRVEGTPLAKRLVAVAESKFWWVPNVFGIQLVAVSCPDAEWYSVLVIFRYKRIKEK